MSDVKRIAERADELIVKHGWQQGALGNKAHGFCLIGALSAAQCEIEGTDKYYLHLGTAAVWGMLPNDVRCAVSDQVPFEKWRPWRWNDSNSRTKESVRNLLKRMAKK